MTLYPFKKPSILVAICLIFVMALAVACGSADAPAKAPAAPAAPAASAPSAAPAAPAASAPSGSSAAPAAAKAPTAKPAPTQVVLGGGETMISFADFWQPPTAVYGEPTSGGHLRIIYEDPLDHGNAWGAASGVTDRYRGPTMNTLIQENPYDAAAPLIPDLAHGWTVDEDNQGITFNFQDDINWHNGEAFVCEDARFSLQTMISGEGLTHSYMAGRLNHVDPASLNCEDDQTLAIRFKAPNPTPLLALSNRRARIFNKAWFEAGGEDAMFQDMSVGTGAYTWDEGQKVGVDTQHFSKNPDYFFGDGTLPYTDRLTITGILDESAQQAAMLSHQGDWHWVRNWGQYQSYVDHDQIQTVIRATRGHLELWLNSRASNAPLDNIRVRQAIIMGIDRAAGIKVLQDGHGSAGFMMAPGSAWELDQAIGCAIPGWCPAEDPEARRAEAKAILVEEGFDFDKTYLFTVESDAQVVGRATFVQEQLRLLGIKTDFDLLETIALRTQEQGGTWGDIMPSNATMAADDPSAGLGGYHRCNSSDNMTHFPDQPCDPKLEALFDQIDGTTDFADRKKLSDEAQAYIMSQYWKLPLYWEQEAVAFWPEVGGYAHFPAPFGSFVKYQHLWINESKRDDKGHKGQMSGLPGGF